MNKDIGFTTVGQDAVVKLEVFPFTRYGTITVDLTELRQMRSSNPTRHAVKATRGTTAGDDVRRRRNNADLSLSRYHQA
ncbi:hypothetical protein [Rhizobium johnstonii]|uniref:hypothetical protein n=1 Tax=Rhizobium johnstonii TaxID=3019933 RepID=UPI003F9A801F